MNIEDAAKDIINRLYQDLSDAYGLHYNKDTCALMGDEGWMTLWRARRPEMMLDAAQHGAEIPHFRLGGWTIYHLPMVKSSGWIIGASEDMLTLRKLWMVSKDKEIRMFLQQWEPEQREP